MKIKEIKWNYRICDDEVEEDSLWATDEVNGKSVFYYECFRNFFSGKWTSRMYFGGVIYCEKVFINGDEAKEYIEKKREEIIKSFIKNVIEED